MESVLKEEDKVEHYVAVEEIQDFVERYNDERPEDFKVEKEYPNFLKALKKGLIEFDDEMKIKYTLAFPGKSEMSEKVIDFKTRIRPMELANITKGLNIAEQQVEYTLRCFAHITKMSKGELNLLNKFDYKVIEQISTVFL